MNKSVLSVLLGLAVFQAAAFAEVISGTITNIDPSSGRVTLRRHGVGDSLDVTVRDRASLSSLRSGAAISVDANRASSGSWEASTVETAGSSQGAPAVSTPSSDQSNPGNR